MKPSTSDLGFTLVGRKMLQFIVLLVLCSLSWSQQLDTTGSCYSSRNCFGEKITETLDCCAPGGGLSYMNGPKCQECFSMENFITEGRSYYVGLYGNFEPPPFFRVGLFRLAVLPAKSSLGFITVKNISGTFNYSVSSEYIQIRMNSLQNVITESDTGDKAIKIESDTGYFSLFAYDEEFTSADAYKALPCIKLPIKQYYEYYAVSVPVARIPVEDEDYDDYEVDPFEPIRGNSVFLIVTCEEHTELTITLTQSGVSNTLSSTFTANNPTSIELENSGSTVLFSSENDLSGSKIISNKPITLISGHQCGSVPSNVNFCDHMAEQIPPTVTWGTRFLTAPIAGRSGFDIFKVIAAKNNTRIDFVCSPGNRRESFNLNEGSFANTSIDSSQYCFVSSTGPILLVQFAVGSSVDNVFRGDPFMVIIPPIDQYKSSYNVWMFRNADRFPENFFVNILVPEGSDTAGILMNGASLADPDVSFNIIQSNSQRYGQAAQVKISDGFYNFTHVNSSMSFNLIAYWGSFRSGSGYFGGMSQKPIALPTISFVSAAYEVFENETVVNVICDIKGSSFASSNVYVSASQFITATPALSESDFISFDQDFVISPGETQLVIPISLVDDVFPENTEQFEVLLHASPGVFIDSPARTVVSILNDDPDLPVMNVSFSFTSVDIREGQIIQLNLIKTPGAVGPVAVRINTQDRTAIVDEDYIGIDNDTITFEVDELLKTVLLITLDDNEVEDMESLEITISPVPGVFPVAVQNNTAIVSVTDNDIAIIGFLQSQYTAIEGTVLLVEFSVLFGQLSRSVFVDFMTENGTAKGGEDFVPVQARYTFDATLNVNSVSISIIDDNVVEQPEGFKCNIQLNSEMEGNVMILQNDAEVTIEDNDTAIITMMNSVDAAVEGRQSARLNFVVSQGQVTGNVLIHLQTFNIEARAGEDYAAVDLIIPLRNLTANEFIIEAIDDGEYEGAIERFLVFATVVNGGHNGRVFVQPSSIEVSIQDIQERPDAQIGFARDSYTVSEDGGQIILLVTSDGGNPETVVVPYTIQEGTAQDDLDVRVIGSEVIFPPGARMATIVVELVDDEITEGNETYFVQLNPTSGVLLGRDRTEITILDNDDVQVSFEQTSYVTSEGGQVNIGVRKVGQADVPVNVTFTTQSGTALAMVDFVPKTTTLTFGTSDTEQSVTVDIMSDDSLEGAGEFFVVKLTPRGNTVQVDTIDDFATVTIMDNPVILSVPGLGCTAISSTINCNWTKSAAETVTNYLLTWEYTGPCDPDVQSALLSGSDREYTLTNLEEGGVYEVSLIALNSVQQGPPAKLLISTPIASPVGSPQFLRTTAVTSNIISLDWDDVDCLEQNGAIELYTIEYGIQGSTPTSNTTTISEITITGLVGDKIYTFRVAASNAAGQGPFSQPLIVSTPIAVVNECDIGTHNCDRNAECIDTRAAFICRCNDGFVGNGSACTDIDECLMGIDNCHSSASCNNTLGSFSCRCLPGYEGDGTLCERINLCERGLHNCHPFAKCEDIPGSFQCQCLPGFTGDGFSCVDVDECELGLHNCHGSAYCNNTLGSFDCHCLSGYQGNGTFCEDIDECANGVHNCHSSAQCVNTLGSFECLCFLGFTGDGVLCADLDECTLGQDNCHAVADCSNTIGSFSCSCLSGYEGNGTLCEDINECELGVDNCDALAECINTLGSYLCLCFPGYTGNGSFCSDIDECKENLDNCHEMASCNNSRGGFTCHCFEGFEGNGTSCEEIFSSLRIGFEMTSYSARENETSQVCVHVLPDQIFDTAVSVTIQSQDVTALSPQDYHAISQVLVFDAETVQQCVEVIALADINTESDEIFTLTLSSTEDSVEFSPQIVNVTIQNTVTNFVVGFGQSEYVVDRQTNRVEALVQIQMGITFTPLIVRVGTSNGNASAGIDYISESRSLFFTPGITEFMFNVRIPPDAPSNFQNITFCMTILSVMSFGSGQFGINQGKAIGVITPDITPLAVPVCGPGLWIQVANLNLTDPLQNCPSPWVINTAPARSCGRNGSLCSSVFFETPRTAYQRVCGMALGYASLSPDAFIRFIDIPGIDGAYLDGVSLTHGQPRQHIWSFGAGHAENFRCPCDNSDRNYAPLPPSFVGNNYFCDGEYNGALWDGQDCTTSCCTFNNPPWFIANLTSPTSDRIEARICYDEMDSNEPVFVNTLFLFVQ